jgi:hypothetical protein
MSDEKNDNEREYPSVGVAYDIAISSYEWLLKRMEANDGIIQTLLTFITTVTLALPVWIHSNLEQAKFRSIWFILALCAFASSVIVTTVARLRGSLRLIDPQQLYDDCLGYSEWEFKKNMIYWAAQDFHENRRAIIAKRRATFLIVCLFLLESLFLAIWAIRALP